MSDFMIVTVENNDMGKAIGKIRRSAKEGWKQGDRVQGWINNWELSCAVDERLESGKEVVMFAEAVGVQPDGRKFVRLFK